MSFPDRLSVETSAATAAVAGLAHAGEDGLPRVELVTPHVLDGAPVFALPYSRLGLARRLAAAPRVSLVFSDPRMAYVGWSPLAVEGRAEVVPDPEGDLFLDELVEDELRKFRPARQLIGNLILRRDNWWYVPRLVVRLADLGVPRPVARRANPDHAVLAHGTGGGVRAGTVQVEDWGADRPRVRPLPAGEPLPESVPAALFRHDFSVPDMEQRASLLVSGRLENGRLRVTGREGTRELGRFPGPIARWRAQMALEKSCKTGLKDPRWGEG